VVGDPRRLGDAVANLLKNAIEYNRTNGRVSVTVWTEGSSAFVRVRDTGIGIADEDLPNIFERFYRADKARARMSGGSGLGLSIVKRVIDDHQGTISTRSQVGVGTEVLVRLPSVLDVVAAPVAS